MQEYRERIANKGQALQNTKDILYGASFGIPIGVIAGTIAMEKLRRGSSNRLTRSHLQVTPSTTERIAKYYIDETDSYLNGQLQGACHFGYTAEGDSFEPSTALRNMELLLGNILNLPPGSKVVDAGSGYGRVATRIAEEFGHTVIGVDLVPQRVEEARRFVQEHGVADKVTIHQGDYTKLSLPDNSVDAVYTMETLCHADPLEAALGEFMRVLKPGGKVVHFEYAVPPYDSMNPVNKRIAEIMTQRIGMASIRRFTHGSFATLLEAAGFENAEVNEISRNVYPTWHWMFQRAIRERVPTALRQSLKGKLMEENTNLAGALFIWPYRRHLGYTVATATKPVYHT